MISIQTYDFNVADEYQAMCVNNMQDGAIVFFVGLVRDFNQGNKIKGLIIEHYPAMTHKTLNTIVIQAKQRWRINRVRLIHRVGELNLNDQIVFVAVSSQHRVDAFESAQFIMDFLKTQAPFWKKEIPCQGDAYWVEAKEKDTQATLRWSL